MEIERKFLVRELPDHLDGVRSSRIEQGYIAIGDDGNEVRVRRRDGSTVLTVKGGHGRTRAEEEIAIDAERFERLWPLTEGRRLEKTRHLIPVEAGLTIELDVYSGTLTGLAVAEVEFDSEAAADAFEPPDWFGREVTDDARFKNQRLACDGVPADRSRRRYGLRPGEPVDEGVRRIARGQIDLALELLDGAGAGDLDDAIHESRKAFKRLRALVRLARDALGDEVYRRENEAFRDAGRALSGARDARVMVDTLEGLTRRYEDEVPDDGFGALHAALVAEAQAAHAGAADDAASVRRVLGELRAARARVDAWPLPAGERLQVLAPGFERVYRRGRRARRAAADEPTTEALHDLRKRAKDLWHAAQVLEPVAPKRMRKLARRAHALSDAVGDDHDLAVLLEGAHARPQALLPGELELLEALVTRRRAELQREALARARRLYARRTRKLVRRVASA